MKANLTIGEVAARFQLATHVLRHWESMGLLTPHRSGGQRRYNTDDLYRVAAIILAKRAGLSLESIAEMEQRREPADRRAVLRRHRDELRDRISQLRACLDLVEHGIDCQHAALPSCPHVRASLDALVHPQ